jgi:hypothetical protein
MMMMMMMMMMMILAQGKVSGWGNRLLGNARQLYALYGCRLYELQEKFLREVLGCKLYCFPSPFTPLSSSEHF